MPLKKLPPLLLSLLALGACESDWRDGILPDEARTEQAVAFRATVVASQTETRADGSLVNRKETSLFPTKARTYYSWDNTTKTAKATSRTYYVGLFGAYTADTLWHNAAYPHANFMFNQRMAIDTATTTGNTLSYAGDTLIRFWPNNAYAYSYDAYGDIEYTRDTSGKLVYDRDGSYEKVSFWAYYPWNATDDPGEYGIHITTADMARGMGRVRFTMHPDASEQSDFMISEFVGDASKDRYPLVSDGAGGTTPSRVPLRFHHMLAQVRIYAFVRGTDKMVYQTKKDSEGHDIVDDDNNPVTQMADGEWFDSWSVGGIITDAWGNVYTKKGADAVGQTTTEKDDLTKAQFVALGLGVPDEEKCVRWYREGGTWDVTHSRRRADISYQLAFNNIYTSCTFEPTIVYDAATHTYTTKATPRNQGTLGSATVNHYIMNPYWFSFRNGQRVMLNDNYMYDYFEDTPAYTLASTDDGSGYTWSDYGGSNAMGYAITGDTGKELADPDDMRGHLGKHFNYAPGNILLVVPQQLDDDNVPNVTITATGYRKVWKKGGAVVPQGTEGATEETETLTGKVTINMLQMNLKWESGFIYCYAFIDNDMKPGDDKVFGPEFITVLFDPYRHTDQW